MRLCYCAILAATLALPAQAQDWIMGQPILAPQQYWTLMDDKDFSADAGPSALEAAQMQLLNYDYQPQRSAENLAQYLRDLRAASPATANALEAQFAGRFNVVFTGTFTPAQSLDMVIRAVLDARAAGAEHLHLLLVGDGMSREALQKQAADLHAGDAVTFYGSVPAADVPRFTALADALLISLSDSPDLGLTVPGKLASYMAAAKPVLASMNGAGYAAVLESGGGLVSPACDQKALADNMLALYRMTDAERAALGAKAKAYYTAHYRRAELLKRLEEFTVKGV